MTAGSAGGRPRFGASAGARAPVGGALRSMVFLLIVIGGLIAWTARPAPGVAVIEVDGVPAPGRYALTQPTVHAAVVAGGGDPSGLPDAALSDGTRLTLSEGAVTLSLMDRPLMDRSPHAPDVFELPLDLNRVSARALAALPGVDVTLARAIVAEREEGGAYSRLDGLVRVPGLDVDAVERLRPFLAVELSEE